MMIMMMVIIGLRRNPCTLITSLLVVCLLVSFNCCQSIDSWLTAAPATISDYFEPHAESQQQQQQQQPSTSPHLVQVSSRGMKMKMSNMVGMMLVPPLIVAGLVPFIIPGFSMAVFLNSLLNNMAFTSAVVSFLRANIFENDPHDNIIYVNHGYPPVPVQHTKRLGQQQHHHHKS